jgi:hypothetical protein
MSYVHFNSDHGHSHIVWNKSDWLKKRQVTAPISPPTNPGAYNETTYLKLEVHKAVQLVWKQFKLAQAVTNKMMIHAFKEYHFHELQEDEDDNVDLVRDSHILFSYI